VEPQSRHALTENDVVLVYVENNPGFFARVEDIVADRKPGWWQVRLLPLIPDNKDLQTMVWILDDDQIRGADFTMQSVPTRVQWVQPYGPEPPRKQPPTSKRGKVVRLARE
jgi:hypothetical protein